MHAVPADLQFPSRPLSAFSAFSAFSLLSFHLLPASSLLPPCFLPASSPLPPRFLLASFSLPSRFLLASFSLPPCFLPGLTTFPGESAVSPHLKSTWIFCDTQFIVYRTVYKLSIMCLNLHPYKRKIFRLNLIRNQIGRFFPVKVGFQTPNTTLASMLSFLLISLATFNVGSLRPVR